MMPVASMIDWDLLSLHFTSLAILCYRGLDYINNGVGQVLFRSLIATLAMNAFSVSNLYHAFLFLCSLHTGWHPCILLGCQFIYATVQPSSHLPDVSLSVILYFFFSI